MNREKQPPTRNYLLLLFDKKHNRIKVGSSKECDVVFHDSVISDVNSILTVEHGELMVYDKNSKFGTFIHTSKRHLSFNVGYRLLNLFFTVREQNNDKENIY